jgi:hypothetical protein
MHFMSSLSKKENMQLISTRKSKKKVLSKFLVLGRMMEEIKQTGI